MCIMAMAWMAHPDWRLILIGNRDEWHARPAAPLAQWEEPEGLIAGRDLLSGGTWLGVSQQGRAAIVTNLRGYGDPKPERASRGALVTDVLAGRDPGPLDAFNPFNLVLIEGDHAQFMTNRPEPIRTGLTPGIYGLSNGSLDAPWPKTLALKGALVEWLMAKATETDQLFEPLRRENIPGAGIAPELPSDVPDEARSSPIFIRNPTYGTRCSTIVAIDAQGNGHIKERRFDADGTLSGETCLPFTWGQAGG